MKRGGSSLRKSCVKRGNKVLRVEKKRWVGGREDPSPSNVGKNANRVARMQNWRPRKKQGSKDNV